MKRLFSILVGLSVASSLVAAQANVINVGSTDDMHVSVIKTGLGHKTQLHVDFFAGYGGTTGCHDLHQYLPSLPPFPFSDNDEFWLGDLNHMIPSGYTCGVLKFNSKEAGEGQDTFALVSKNNHYVATFPQKATIVLKR